MGTIGEESDAYVAPTTKNITELEKVSIDFELKNGEDKDDKGVPYTYKYFELNGEKYRVPKVVLGSLKLIRKKIPDLKYFVVLKEGTGLATKYQVLPVNTATPEGFI